MRNLTCSPVVDGDNNLVSPTQNIWGGTEFKSRPRTAFEQTRDNTNKHIVTETPAKGSCPSPAVEAAHSEWLWHCQTDTHWCSLNSLKMVIDRIGKHAESVMVERNLEPQDQKWIFIMDCYGVHISLGFLTWAKEKWPRMIPVFIYANCTAWLQPLDISFNGPFKRMLREEAGTWLAQHMQEQLAKCSDPSKVELNISLTYLRPLMVKWLAKAHERMSKEHATIKRGWDLSGMGEAFHISQGDSPRESPEFKEAEALNANGKLFEKFTDKKNADLAEITMRSRFFDLLGESRGDQDVEDVEADEIADEMMAEATRLAIATENRAPLGPHVPDLFGAEVDAEIALAEEHINSATDYVALREEASAAETDCQSLALLDGADNEDLRALWARLSKQGEHLSKLQWGRC